MKATILVNSCLFWRLNADHLYELVHPALTPLSCCEYLTVLPISARSSITEVGFKAAACRCYRSI